MKSVQLISQPDICDEQEYHIRQTVGQETVWHGRNGYPYQFSPQEYIDPALPVFNQAAFTLKIGAGKFLHRGAWDWVNYNNKYAMVKLDCHLSGAGRWTELCLSNPVQSTGGVIRPDVHMLGIGSDYMDGSRALVENLSLTANDNIPKNVLITSGIRAWGRDIRIRNVRITGIRGSFTPAGSLMIPYEAFGISFGGSSQGNIVEDCYAEGGNYFSAFSSAVSGAKFVDCHAYSQDGYAGFTVYDNTKAIDCSAHGFAYGIYNDTMDLSNVHVARSEFAVSRVCIGIVAVTPNDDKQSIKVVDCDFGISDVGEFVGLELIDKSPNKTASFDDIEIVGCRFQCDPLTIVSTDSKRVTGVRLVDCMFPKDCKMRANGNEIEIIRPRNLNGSLRTEQIPQAV